MSRSRSRCRSQCFHQHEHGCPILAQQGWESNEPEPTTSSRRTHALDRITDPGDAAAAAKRAALAQRQTGLSAKLAAGEAYRRAMPPLIGADYIRDFIACVAHGMLLGIFTTSESTKLLYAAQVAGGMAQNRASKAS